MKRKWIFWAPIAIVAFVAFIALGGEVVRLLWNGLLPTLFGWPPITFWQALGLLALCRILFGNIGLGGGSYRSRSRRRMDERWEQMTPEERERFRQGLHGHAAAPDSTPPA
jgi:hypothetical protein